MLFLRLSCLLINIKNFLILFHKSKIFPYFDKISITIILNSYHFPGQYSCLQWYQTHKLTRLTWQLYMLGQGNQVNPFTNSESMLIRSNSNMTR